MIPGRILNEMCAAAGVDPKAVYEVEATPHDVTFFCYSQHEGRPYRNASRERLVRHWVTVPIDWSNAC